VKRKSAVQTASFWSGTAGLLALPAVALVEPEHGPEAQFRPSMMDCLAPKSRMKQVLARACLLARQTVSGLSGENGRLVQHPAEMASRRGTVREYPTRKMEARHAAEMKTTKGLALFLHALSTVRCMTGVPGQSVRQLVEMAHGCETVDLRKLSMVELTAKMLRRILSLSTVRATMGHAPQTAFGNRGRTGVHAVAAVVLATLSAHVVS